MVGVYVPPSVTHLVCACSGVRTAFNVPEGAWNSHGGHCNYALGQCIRSTRLQKSADSHSQAFVSTKTIQGVVSGNAFHAPCLAGWSPKRGDDDGEKTPP
ncbi:hypothetical protein FRC08_018429 [Ceratobasidium sp. 394]|nr:hypothetical protein FRC08_018429 [Ceratobasidium sp. 394]